jgi:glucose-1-phosphate adenylyltransferase
VPADQTHAFGIMRLDDSGKVLGFVEKPKTEEARAPYRVPGEWIDRQGIPSRGREYLASMGIYLFKRQTLFELLGERPHATDFGKDVFPRVIRTKRVQAHLFDGYWEDVGTVKSYHEASLALADEHPPFDFHSDGGVIFTRMRYLPASRISAAKLENCLVSDGCLVRSGSEVTRCVLGVRTRIGHDCRIRDTVLIGADRFETDEECADNRSTGLPNIGVGDGTVIERAILDKDCRIGANVKILNRRGVGDAEGENYVIRDGIVVIPKGAIVPDGAVI